MPACEYSEAPSQTEVETESHGMHRQKTLITITTIQPETSHPVFETVHISVVNAQGKERAFLSYKLRNIEHE